MMFSRHPGYRTLNRFADGELSPEKYQRVAAHLADCGECRQEVAFIRRAGDLARSLETPPAPDKLLDDVLSRRADGERVLLPLESPGSSSPTPWKVAPAAAAVLVLFLVGVFASTGILEANRGGLDIEPERPRAGQTLTVAYEDDGQFAAGEYLKLRARFRTGSGNHWEQVAGILVRRDENLLETEISMPDSVVYAAFAVEDLYGDQVDSNNRELWEVLAHGADGRPTPAALSAKLADVYVRHPAEAYRTARRTAELYPSSPRGWSWQWTFEQAFATADSLRDLHLDRLRRFERAFSERTPADPEELAQLAWYASQLGEWASADYWAREARRRNADSGMIYQVRATLLRVSDGQRPAEALHELDALWREAPFPVAAAADAGWALALEAGDWRAAMLWLPRRLAARERVDPHRTLEDLAAHFEPDRVLTWAMTHLDDGLLTPGPRPLSRRSDQHQRESAQLRQRTLATAARIALETGRNSVATGLAVQALPLAWVTPALETIGTVLLEAGDTASAVVAFARATADPLGEPPPESVTREPGWAAALETARAELTRYVMAESVIRYAPDELETGNRPSLVAFEFTCNRKLARLEELARSLEPIEVTVYTTFDPDATVGREGRCADLAIPVRLDSTGEIGHAFRVRGYPSYYVTDAHGRIRFEQSRMDEIPRQLEALERASSPRAVD